MFPNSNDWQQLPHYLSQFNQLTTDFIASLEQRPVASRTLTAPNLSLPQQGLSIDQLMETLKSEVIPNLSGSRGPRYFGFVTGGATPVATMADWLVATFDQNVSKGGDSIATNIERQTIQWLTELFELPEDFKGLFTTGATAANFLAAVTARQFVGTQQGIDVAKDGLFGIDIQVFSATPHASMVKGLGLAGLGQQQYSSVPCLANSEAMDVAALQQLMMENPAKGKVVIASAATVTGTDFDDLKAIREICDQHQAWLHVDAAFGIFERLLNGKNGKTEGIELADSITLDAHKWLNVPYDCGIFLTRQRQYLFESCDVPAPYLVREGNEPEFMSLGIENSRRFRALPVWMSLLAYGRQGIKSWVGNNVDLAGQLADWFEQSEHYELVYYGQLNVVLFRPNCQGKTQQQADLLTKALLQRINRDGRIFLSPGAWQGSGVIRAALSNWQTGQQDIDITKAALQEVLALVD